MSARRLLLATTALVGLTAPAAALDVTKISTLKLGDEGASEIVAFDAGTKRLFVTNSPANAVEVIDLSDPAAPTRISTLSMADHGTVNSVAAKDGLVAVAAAAPRVTDPGRVAFFGADDGVSRGAIEVCALPDMVTFTPDGRRAVVACEGEPSDDVKTDPEGAVAIIDIRDGRPGDLRIADFTAWNDQPVPEGARIGRPGATAAQDFEPEYIAVAPDSKTAYVTLQENNAVALVDLEAGRITDVVGLGWKDFSQVPMDASDKDGGINMKTWPVWGMYQPDSIAAFTAQGQTWLAIANEGDSRDYDGWSEEVRVADLTLDPEAHPDAAELQKPENLGRLKTTITMGDTDGDGDIDRIHAYGGRSFAILDAKGRMVWDSGADIERMLAENHEAVFNVDEDTVDGRSDDKGAEPEALTAGLVGDTPYVFVGLERVGGFVIYDATNPTAPVLVTYVDPRNLHGMPDPEEPVDLAPEGMTLIPAARAPGGAALLVVANEVSGTTSIFRLTE